MESFDISVIVCTKNREEKLFETIDSLVSQKTNDDFTYEILIIDSSDDNSMKTKLLKRYPDFIKYYWDPNFNLSEARNFGIHSTKGRILAFIDDDGIAGKSWLSEHYNLYFDSSVLSVGGKIVPKWLCKIPSWLSPEMLTYLSGYLSLLDIGSEVKQIRFPEMAYGCNMSFRKDVFSENLLFDKKLGRMGDTLMSNEEAYLYYLIDQKGCKVMYTPFAIVHHQIGSSRLTKSFFNKRSYWDGVSNARMDKMILNKNQRANKCLKLFIIKIPKNVVGYMLYSWVLRSRYRAFVHKLRIINYLGYIFGKLKSL